MRVLLVYFDTLRVDHVSCYGYVRYTTPNLDRLALEGALFTNAYPTDTPAHPGYTALFAGRRGVSTGVVGQGQWEEREVRETVTFPQALSEKGIVTAAVSTLPRFRSRFAKGFGTYLHPGVEGVTGHVTAQMVNDRAIPWLQANAGKDFFLFLHYWDPHTPYHVAPEEYVRRFYDGNPYEQDNRSLEGLRGDELMRFHLESGAVPELARGLTDLEYPVAQYDAEIAHADERMAEVLEALEETGGLEDTLVVITSDHGEGLGEHGVYFDHMNAYEEVAHVPLVVWHPERVAPRNIPALVEHTDIAPTVLEAFGLEVPRTFQGKSLWPVMTGEQADLHESVVTSHGMWSAQRAMRTRDWTLVNTLACGVLGERGKYQLFDRNTDPCEMHDLTAESPEVAGMMRARYEEWLKRELGDRRDPLVDYACSGRQGWDWLKHRHQRREQVSMWKGYPLPTTMASGSEDEPVDRPDTVPEQE